MKPRTYIAGPMSNCPDYNYPAFHAAAARLRAAGKDQHGVYLFALNKESW